MRTLLIDGDILAFTVAARAETKIDWGDSEPTRHANLDEAKSEALRWMREITADLEADDAIVALSDPRRRYFRHDIYSKYKHDRTHGETPLVLFDLKDYLRTDAFKSKTKPDLEADDVLGILATHPTLIPGEKVIVTADKDLLQIAGQHFNPRKPDLGIVTVTPEAADEWFYTQALTGDPTDGFPGCPGIGPVKAKKILAAAAGMASDLSLNREGFVWRAIVAAYTAAYCLADRRGRTEIVAEFDKYGGPEGYALAMARVARMLRASDYDFENNKPILWTPQPAPSLVGPA